MLISLYTYQFIFFFFNDTATTDIYTLSLHDALPILPALQRLEREGGVEEQERIEQRVRLGERSSAVEVDRADRKSTRLNSSHQIISYAVFCLKKKNKKPTTFKLTHSTFN